MPLPAHKDAATQQAFEAAVRAQCAHFSRSFEAGDIEGLVTGYYVDDPCMIGPDMPLLQGRASIRGALQQIRDSGVTQLVLEPVSCTVDETFGFEIGRARLTTGGGVQNARYIIGWRKCADGWRAETDMFAMGDI